MARRARKVYERDLGTKPAFFGVGSTTFSVGRSSQRDYIIAIEKARTYAPGTKTVIEVPVYVYKSGARIVSTHGMTLPRHEREEGVIGGLVALIPSIASGTILSLAAARLMGRIGSYVQVPFVGGVGGKVASAGLFTWSVASAIATASIAARGGKQSKLAGVALGVNAARSFSIARSMWISSPLTIDAMGVSIPIF